MKKLLAVLMVLVLTALTLPVLAAEEATPAGTVEIQFCVGDSTLLINGEEVAVETPYVVGDGVTLVPLRVITEAFGAQVGWIEETRTITLSYPDVEIVLQIGNSVAEVNGVAETLLAAPELPGDSTMVPLRFISETFGATVGYDEATERITVTKSASKGGEIVSDSAIDTAKIGDSFYGWSMDNPKDFIMDERSFDGIYTSFTYDENNWFCIFIDPLDEDMKSFDKLFNEEKSYYERQTLIRADKGKTENGYDFMRFQAKDKTDFEDYLCIVTDKRMITINSNFAMDNAEIREKGIACIDSFLCDYDPSADIYDLSTTDENGYRTFESKEMKLSFNVPADYYMSSYEDSLNSFEFSNTDPKDYVSRLACTVFSKSDGMGAKEIAEHDRAFNLKVSNEEISTFTEVEQTSYAGLDAYEYTYKANTTVDPFYTKDVFFEIGEYVYNLGITLPLDTENKEEFATNILNSFKAEALDSKEIGLMLRNFPEEQEGTYEETIEGATMTLSNNFTELYSDTYMNMYTGVMFSVYTQDAAFMSTLEKKTFASEYYKAFKKETGVAIVEPLRTKKVGNISYEYFLCTSEEEEDFGYIENYLICKNNTCYCFVFLYSELGYSKVARESANAVIESVTFK
ncbi:MAG: copper amine oxidase N-terminal domain-containing protein [Clostridia bacterium]|nr:copper amine oxidase N-terminal domain-containing protein [Clostridia bacterium]